MGGLSTKISAINTKVVAEDKPAVILTLPSTAIEKEIHRLCSPGMHRPNIFSVIAKLSTSGISHDAIIANAGFFEQYISPESNTMKNTTVVDLIEEYRKDYGHQVGTRPYKKKDMERTPDDCFSEDVYNNLPTILNAIFDLIEEPRKRDVALIGILAANSGAYTSYRFQHGSGSDVKEYSPHLITMVIGQPGGGKGGIRYGNTMVDKIGEMALKKQSDLWKNYSKAMTDYEIEIQRYKAEGKKGGLMNFPEKPERPPRTVFQASISDTSHAALIQALQDNPLGIFALDAEIDTMIEGGKKSFGGTSDTMRKCFHHEQLARQRKMENESYIVKSPRMACCLSGTNDQLKKLISSEHNGLFSRVFFYIIPPTQMPYLPPSPEGDIVGEECKKLQDYILQSSKMFQGEFDYVHMTFSETQEDELLAAMADKAQAEEKHGGDIGASWLRMGLVIKRIAVTLAGVQQASEGIVPDNCWRAAMAMLPTIKQHCIAALQIVRENMGKINISKDSYNALKASGKTEGEIAKELGCTAKTLYSHRKSWE